MTESRESVTSRQVFLSFEADFALKEEEIWPDGDAPENWTVADVVRRIASEGDLASFITDWSLDNDIRVGVSCDGEYKEVEW